MSYRETLFASLEVKKPQVAAGRQKYQDDASFKSRNSDHRCPYETGGPLGKLGQISKAPYTPIAGPASPHAGVSAWFVLGVGWSGLAQRPFSRASLVVLRSPRTLGLVGLAWQA